MAVVRRVIIYLYREAGGDGVWFDIPADSVLLSDIWEAEVEVYGETKKAIAFISLGAWKKRNGVITGGKPELVVVTVPDLEIYTQNDFNEVVWLV